MPVRCYQYDAQPQTEPSGSGKPVARRDERMGYGHKISGGKAKTAIAAIAESGT